MPKPNYIEFGVNDETGEHWGLNGDTNAWEQVHPSHVRLAQETKRQQQQSAVVPDRWGSLVQGVKTAAGEMGQFADSVAQAGQRGGIHGVAWELGKGIVNDATTRLGNVGEMVKRPGFFEPMAGLPQRGRAAAQTIGALTGTGKVADIVEAINPDPFGPEKSPEEINRKYEGIGQAGVYGPVIAAPLATAKGRAATGSMGRGLQQSGMKSLAKATGATGKEIDNLITPSGRHNQAPAAVVLERGGVVSGTRGRLLKNLEQKAASTGKNIAEAEAQYKPGDVSIDPAAIQQRMVDEIRKVARPGESHVVTIKGGKKVKLPKGKSAPDDVYIRQIFEETQDAMANTDLPDALHMRRDVLDPAISQAKGFAAKQSGMKDIPRQNRAFAQRDVRSVLADEIDRVTPEIVPDRQYVSATNKMIDVTKHKLANDWQMVFGFLPKTVARNAAARVLGYTASGALGWGAAAALVDLAVTLQKSTLRRTGMATIKYNLGKFLEAGDIHGAAAYAQQQVGAGAGAGSGAGSASSTASPGKGGSAAPAGGAGAGKGIGSTARPMPASAFGMYPQTNTVPRANTPASGRFPVRGLLGDGMDPAIPEIIEGEIVPQIVPSSGPAAVSGLPQRPALPPASRASVAAQSVAERQALADIESARQQRVRGPIELPSGTAPSTPPAEPVLPTRPQPSVVPSRTQPSGTVAKEMTGERPKWAEDRIAANRQRQEELNRVAATAKGADRQRPLGELAQDRRAAAQMPTQAPDPKGLPKRETATASASAKVNVQAVQAEIDSLTKQAKRLGEKGRHAEMHATMKKVSVLKSKLEQAPAVPSRETTTTATATTPATPATKHKYQPGRRVTGTYKLTGASGTAGKSARNAFKEFEVSGRIKGTGTSKDGKAIYFVETPEGSRIIFEENIVHVEGD